MSILYKDKTDRLLSADWNPDCDYGNEYVNVHFRIDTNGYDYPSFQFTEEDMKGFDADIVKVFTALGWNCKEEAYNGSCSTWNNGKSHLYMHPQDFSGEVLKNDVKIIAEALENNTTFKLRWVDLYETVYDITDEEYEEFLSSKNEEIRKAALEQCKTRRRTQFCYINGVVKNLSDKFRLIRIGDNDGRNYGIGQTGKYITKVIEQLIDEGYIVSVQKNKYETLVRTINKAEQKERKLFIT